MSILLGISGSALTAIIAGAVFLILVVAGILRKMHPEKKQKPLRKM
jgi:hypothetical protein